MFNFLFGLTVGVLVAYYQPDLVTDFSQMVYQLFQNIDVQT
jgi:hypothetical protein